MCDLPSSGPRLFQRADGQHPAAGRAAAQRVGAVEHGLQPLSCYGTAASSCWNRRRGCRSLCPTRWHIDPAEAEARLRAIPAYVELFDKAFGGSGVDTVTFDNVTRALAAFQRTLISQNSAYDRYVAGNSAALTPQQQRGMALFFSERTHCAECHQPPLFALENFRVTGIPSDDLGRAAVSEKGIKGAFKVPTLRNVALSAPYMHNGALATLDEVVQFYADGAGRANGFERVDPLLKGFDLTARGKGRFGGLPQRTHRRKPTAGGAGGGVVGLSSCGAYQKVVG